MVDLYRWIRLFSALSFKKLGKRQPSNSRLESNNVGMSAAAGLFQSVLGFIVVVSANAFVKKVDNDNALF